MQLVKDSVVKWVPNQELSAGRVRPKFSCPDSWGRSWPTGMEKLPTRSPNWL